MLQLDAKMKAFTPADLACLSAGTASYIWTVNIGSSFTQTFTIGTVVSGYYLRNSPADDVVITVLKGKPGKKK